MSKCHHFLSENHLHPGCDYQIYQSATISYLKISSTLVTNINIKVSPFVDEKHLRCQGSHTEPKTLLEVEIPKLKANFKFWNSNTYLFSSSSSYFSMLFWQENDDHDDYANADNVDADDVDVDGGDNDNVDVNVNDWSYAIWVPATSWWWQCYKLMMTMLMLMMMIHHIQYEHLIQVDGDGDDDNVDDDDDWSYRIWAPDMSWWWWWWWKCWGWWWWPWQFWC